VTLAHGSNSNLCGWLPYARELAASGYRALAYDARHGSRVDLDAEAAVEALRRAGAQRVVAVGSSLGALAAIVAGASLPLPPAAIVSLSAPADFGLLRGLDAVRALRAPVFFAASQDDDPFAADAQALYAAAGSPERRLEILPGAAHGVQMLADASFRARVTAFISAH
jgi:pimeloyl-ACP methyl ester carboxylesterase